MTLLPNDVRMESPCLKRTDDGLEITMKTFITTKGEVIHELKTFTLSVSNVGLNVQIGDLAGVNECVDLWIKSNPRLTKNEALRVLSVDIEDLYDQTVALEFKKRVDGKW